MDIVIIWTPCIKTLFFQVPNKGLELITPDPLVLKGHTVPHLKALVPKAQKHNVYLSIFSTLLKMSTFGANMKFIPVSFHR